MKPRTWSTPVLTAVLALAAAGCHRAPGKPGPESLVKRPDQVLEFAALYGQNCAACHGDRGHNGAAISLASPIYLATAGAANMQRIITDGVPGTMMPPFARSRGGMLTDAQIGVLVRGMIDAWANPSLPALQSLPQYAGAAKGDAARGQAAFTTYCARCHGKDGAGDAMEEKSAGSVVDPAYLSLVSDQGLRTIVIAGQPEQGMPDWRSDAIGSQSHPMTDQEITDVVAWLAAHRTATPGQPYPQYTHETQGR